MEFIARQTGVEPHRLAPSTEIRKDIGVEGDDAEELMDQVRQEFDVDMRDFQLSKHFGPEAPFSLIWYLFTLIFEPQLLKFTPITIADLVQSARQKRWRPSARLASA
jgi:hypothetical protein